jgi:hypothetical protein
MHDFCRLVRRRRNPIRLRRDSTQPTRNYQKPGFLFEYGSKLTLDAIFIGKTTLSKLVKLKTILTAILLIFLFISVANPQSSTEQTKEEKARKRELKRETALNLWRLKKSLEEGIDGFYAGRVALNIWKSNAIDAGTFDQKQYDEFKQKLYERSVMKSLECFEYFIEKQKFHDANMCLQTWKIHSQELELFDQTKYDELNQKLSDAKAKKAEEDKKMHEGKQ